jgi:hypothetical protein
MGNWVKRKRRIGEEGKAEAENRGWGEGERNRENARVRDKGRRIPTDE